MKTEKIGYKLVDLFDQMYKHTRLECAQCRVPYSCCSAEYCEMTRQYAEEEFDIIIEPTSNKKIPFLGEHGCIVRPFLRPWCTLHTCAINSLGFKPNDPKWTKKYFQLRDKIEKEQDRIEQQAK